MFVLLLFIAALSCSRSHWSLPRPYDAGGRWLRIVRHWSIGLKLIVIGKQTQWKGPWYNCSGGKPSGITDVWVTMRQAKHRRTYRTWRWHDGNNSGLSLVQHSQRKIMTLRRRRYDRLNKEAGLTAECHNILLTEMQDTMPHSLDFIMQIYPQQNNWPKQKFENLNT
jgi:hypothetical protein